MFRHVLRNATRTLPLIVTLNASEAILTLAGLGFLGFGIEPTAAAEWGYDLQQGARRRHQRHLVDGDLPGRRDRARRARPDAGRREPQRPRRPAAAGPQDALRRARRRPGLPPPARQAVRSTQTSRRRVTVNDRPAARAHDHVVDIDDLESRSPPTPATSYAVEDVSLTVGRRRGARDRRRDPAAARPSPPARSWACCPRPRSPAARSLTADGSERHGRHATAKLRRRARPRRRDGVPGAVHRAQPGLHGRLADRRGAARARQVHARREAPSARRSRSCARSASPTRSTGSTTTRTSSPAGRSSAS